MRRRKILILIKSFGLGGAERLIIDSLPYLDQTQFDYTFAYFLPWKGFLVPQITAAGFPVYCLGTATDNRLKAQDNQSLAQAGGKPINGPSSREIAGRLTVDVIQTGNPDPTAMEQTTSRGPQNPINQRASSGGGWPALGVAPHVLRRLVDLQRQEEFDLIHADMPLPGILARVLGRWQGIPVIYTEHNLQERYHPMTRWANSLTYAWNKRVLAVSQEVAASIARAGLIQKTQVLTLLNGVPVEHVRAEASDLNGLRAELEIPDNHLVVGTVAVFRTQKRLQDWIEVAGKIAAQREDVTFLLVGHGPEEAAIRAKVRLLGLADRVRLPGFRPDGRRVMALMDVYLMSSKFEGLPIAMLEAMALGKPIVSTAVGGVPELVQAEESGFLTQVGDLDALADYTLKLLDDPECRQQMGRSGAERVETEFHLKHRVSFIERLYFEVLQEAAELTTPAAD